MLTDLFGGNSSQIETGTIEENLLDGYYRVKVGSMVFTARNQSTAPLSLGSVVSVMITTWGRFIVSTPGRQAMNIPTIIIRG